MSRDNVRNLSDFEQQLLLKWRLVPEELWSKPDLYRGDSNFIQNELILSVQKNGLQFLGFSK